MDDQAIDPLSRKRHPHPPTPTPTPNPQPTSGGSHTLLVEPDQGLAPLYNLLSSARTSIEMTMYELSDPEAIAILTSAPKKGLQVRVILDQNNERANNSAAFNTLQAAGVGVHWANPAFFCTHQKTITVDAATSAILTLNLVPADYPTSRDFGVLTTNPADVAAIQATFNADFTDAPIAPPTGQNLVWSPTNSRAAITALIGGATQSLLIAQEEMADPAIEAALSAALKRGVSLTLVQENLGGKYSAALKVLKAAGARIATYSSRTGYYIHTKAILVDYGAEGSLFLGSENFSTDSLDKNRELGLIFSDSASMAGVQAAITADFENGTMF